MKPLLLRMQAFGPFAQVQEIDFRRLGDKTFFLIHGPTGSGKTSVLDGMCFALFGDSSGGEREARRMRSHHAQAGTLTEVSFEFALGPARYRVQRVPEQMRKSLRGGGETRQAPNAELFKLEGEGDARVERPLATGWGKVTEQVVQLLGFESRQFRQVIVLPQGKFFEFLKSSSQEREKILQVLFGTELYKRIEEALKRAADDLQQRARDVRARRGALLDQAGVADEAGLAARLQQQREALEACEATAQSAATQASQAESQLVAARRVADLFTECDAAREALAMLDAQQPEWQRQQALLDAMRRAAALRPYESAMDDAREALAREQRLCQERERALVVSREKDQRAQQAHELQRARAPQLVQLATRQAELEALRGRVALLDEARRAQASGRAAHAQARAALAQALQASTGAGQALRTLDADIERLTPEAAGLPLAQLALESLTAMQARLARREQLLAEQARAEKAVQQQQAAHAAAEAARAQAATRRRATLDAWIAGQSARIAFALAPGQACPVCGSQAHPAPAQAALDAVGEEALTACEQAFEQADAACAQALRALALARERLASLQGEALAVAAQDAAVSQPGELAEELRAAQSRLKQAEAASRSLGLLQQQLPLARQQAQAAEAALAGAQQRVQQAAIDAERADSQLAERQRDVPPRLASLASLQAEVKQVEDESAALRESMHSAETAAQSSARELAGLAVLVAESARACAARQAEVQAKADDFLRRLRLAFGAESAAVGEGGSEGECDGEPERQAWADYEDAKADEASVRSLEARITSWQQALAAGRERLLRAQAPTLALARPDVPTLAAAHARAQAELLQAGQATAQARAALDHTSRFAATLDRIAREFGEIEERHAVLRSLSDAATGQNAQRMSFQRYVLATLLEEVLAATTLRLRVMSRGRYEMRRRIEAGDARAAGGLDLEVFDHYTGSTRPVDTLSGGESFLASLALALGLSDVVQSHAGGIRLDAIFVDEGFGTLDPEALDFAIRTLKDLQQAGRMVGIISHVGELREWIDARLELKASRGGSQAEFVL